MNNDSSLLCCPNCHGKLTNRHTEYTCDDCSCNFGIKNGIPSLFIPNDWIDSKPDITSRMRAFYEKTPFPNYDEFDNIGTLLNKSREGIFARLLDEQIPLGSNILDCGCGTGQLTNFLAIANRQVHGVDMCMNSLNLATNFKNRNQLSRAKFIQMNLFKPCFKKEEFDLVISNGVLHHTSDPHLAFETISKLVKPGGYILIGLYHRYGRLATDLRRKIFNVTKEKYKQLDKRWNSDLESTRKETWFMDQYKNPHESKHTITEVLNWFDRSEFNFIRTIPSTNIFKSIDENIKLFEHEPLSNRFERAITTGSMIFSGHLEGGFFIMIGQKKK